MAKRWTAVSVAVWLGAIASPPPARACTLIPRWHEGRESGLACKETVRAQGLTVLDLGEAWLPPVLAPDEGGGPSYAHTYLALADERFADADGDAGFAPSDRYFELFGIAPSWRVIARRFADDARHRCHAAIDDRPLAETATALREESAAHAAARRATARALREALTREATRRKLADLDALAATDAAQRKRVERLLALEAQLAAVRAVQAHLACDGLFAARPIDGAYTWQTRDAVERFQRGAFVLPTGSLDADTREAFALDSRERDLRTALRGLRERVVAATGLIEDGTAGAGPGLVLGRALDARATWQVRGAAALPNAAPDRIAEATEAAARALGWRDAETTARFLEALTSRELAGRPREVAVALPPMPRYHAATMELAVEIDRADARPWADAGAPRPSLVLYARDEIGRIALVRWPTTIGGWQDQLIDGTLARRWKQSPAGPRVWRDLFVGPRWLPPDTTPDRELVRGGDGHYALARSLLGPSYRAAFGLIALVHLAERPGRDGPTLEDEGIRTHGTGNLTSLANGSSHGCHRVLGRNAVRLAGFLIAHREVRRHGEAPTYYHRVVRYGGEFPITIESLGYRIELVPPISVEVLPGRTR